jgi:colicin import membrane protein
MKRVTIIIAVLAALGIGGYFVLQAQNAAVERAAAEQAAADQAAAEAAEAAAAEAAAAEAAAAEAAAAEAATAEAAAAEAALADQAGQAQDALSALFSVEGFDFDRAMTALEGADIPALARTALTAALAAARDNPDLLPTALAQARNALGLGQ